MNSIWNKTVGNVEWWKAVGIRCLKTFAECAATALTTCGIATGWDWVKVLPSAAGAGVLGAVICIFLALKGLPEANLDDFNDA